VVTGAPSADRRKQLKIPFIVGGAVVALIVLILVIRTIFSATPATTSPSVPAARPATTETQEGDVVRLIAIDNVHVRVVQLSNRQELFSGDLVKGETRYIRKDGKIQVFYNPGRNLRVEVRGQQYKMTIDGDGYNTLQ
jgi:hypothetical protein